MTDSKKLSVEWAEKVFERCLNDSYASEQNTCSRDEEFKLIHEEQEDTEQFFGIIIQLLVILLGGEPRNERR